MTLEWGNLTWTRPDTGTAVISTDWVQIAEAEWVPPELAGDYSLRVSGSFGTDAGTTGEVRVRRAESDAATESIVIPDPFAPTGSRRLPWLHIGVGVARVILEGRRTGGAGGLRTYEVGGFGTLSEYATLAPALTTAPVASSSDLKVGTVASVTTGTWTGTPPISYRFQWQRIDPTTDEVVDITGATGSSYTFTEADLESNIRALVVASNDQASVPALSNVLGPIIPVDVVPELAGRATSALVAAAHDAALVVSVPSGTLGGDYVIVPIVSRLTGTVPPTITAPAGFTLLAGPANGASRDSQHLFAYGKVAGGTAGDPTTDTTYSFTTGSTGNVWIGFARSYSDADNASPVLGTPQGATSSGSAQFTAAEYTASGTGSRLINVVGSNDEDALAFAADADRGFTLVAGGASYHTALNNNAAIGLAELAIPSSGVVSMPTWEQETAVTGTDPWTSIVLELKASAATGGGGGGSAPPPAPPDDLAWPELIDHGPTSFAVVRTVNVSTVNALQAAFDDAVAGDDIVIAAGSYTGTLNLTADLGTGKARVRAADGATVTITSPTASGTQRAVLYAHGARGWHFGSSAGTLIFDGAGYSFAVIGLGLMSGSIASTSSSNPAACRDIWLHNLELRNSGQGGLRVAYNSYDIDVTDTYIHAIGQSNPNFGEGVYVGSASGTDRTHDLRLNNVEITDCGAEGIDVKPNSYNVSVIGGRIHDIALNAQTIGSTRGTYTKGGIAFRSPAPGMVIDDTRIWNITRTGSSEFNEAVGVYAAGQFTSKNLLIWNCQEGGIRLAAPSGSQTTIKHATFWANGPYAMDRDSGDLTLDACLYPSGGLVGTITTTRSAAATASDFVGPLTGAAQITYPGEGYVLRQASPHVDAVSAQVSTDLRGVGRPQGSTGDRGAFEGVAVTSPPPGSIDDPVLTVDFATVSPVALDNASTMESRWRSLLGSHYARSYGLADHSIVSDYLRVRMDGTVTGVRAGESAERIPAGPEAWLTYEVWFEDGWPAGNGKLPGLCGGSSFPSGGDEHTDGFSARFMFNDTYLTSYNYHYRPDRPTYAGEKFHLKSDGNVTTNSGSLYQRTNGVWLKVTQRVRMNSAPTVKDGWLEWYVGTTLRVRRTNLRWHGPLSTYEPVVDGFYASIFWNSTLSPAAFCRIRNIEIGKTAASVGLSTTSALSTYSDTY